MRLRRSLVVRHGDVLLVQTGAAVVEQGRAYSGSAALDGMGERERGGEYKCQDAKEQRFQLHHVSPFHIHLTRQE